MGRGRRRRAFGSRSNNFIANYDFDLFTQDDNRQIRTRNDDGTFIDAVENFQARFEDVTARGAGNDENGDPIREEEFSFYDAPIRISNLFAENGDDIRSGTPITLDLTTRLLNANDTLTLLNGNNVIASSDTFDFGLEDSDVTREGIQIDTARIEYIIHGFEDVIILENNDEITELALIIEDADPETKEFEIDFNGDGDLELLDVNAAQTSIDFIIDNELLGLINGVRFSGAEFGNEFENTTNIVSTESEPDGLTEPGVGDIEIIDPPEDEDDGVPVDDGDGDGAPGDVSFEPVFGTIDGDVIEVEGSNQIIFAGDLNDLVDASIGSEGGNRIYAGCGDDTIILGEGDRVIGGDGDDIFYATSGGDNTITGGEGADQFWIATAEVPEETNLITDFTIGEDVIGIAGFGIGFADVSLTQQGDDALIATDGNDFASLQNIDITDLNSDDFVFS